MSYEDDGPFFPDAEATALHYSAERCRLHAELAPGLNRTKVTLDGICCIIDPPQSLPDAGWQTLWRHRLRQSLPIWCLRWRRLQHVFSHRTVL